MTAHSRDAWRMSRAGSLDRLRRTTEPLARPGPGEARVAVKAIGLNFADVFACLGLYSATPKGSFVPGLEFAGIIEDAEPRVGIDAPALRPGTPVMGVTRFGGYTTALNVDAAYLRRLPAGWSFEEGAAFPVQALTAWYGLVRLARVSRAEVVLVHSAAGGVGLNALQLLDAIGARVIATVRGAVKQAFLVERAGLDLRSIVVRDRASFGAQLDSALEYVRAPGLDVVFDAIAGPYFRPAFERLRPEGRYVIYGAADFMPRGARPGYLRLLPRYLRRPRLDPVQMIGQNRSVLGFNLIWLWDEVERLAAGYAAIEAVITAPPFVGRTFLFDAVPAAMRWLQQGDSVGKIVVTVDTPGQVRDRNPI
jgi:synaptic vesicle membrane protein VAT-1